MAVGKPFKEYKAIDYINASEEIRPSGLPTPIKETFFVINVC